MYGTIKATTKLCAFFLLSLLLVPPQLVVMAFTRGRAAYILPHVWERCVCFIFGLKVIVEGKPYTTGQTLYIANHLSYLDIPVIASVLKASFVAKEDVAGWPVFGFLSKMQQTAFISRSRTQAAKGRYALQNMLKDGKSLIIFPEGTSSDGQKILPFKSSLFSIAHDLQTKSELMVQPMTLSLVKVNGQLPHNQTVRDRYAWHGDMTLSPHLWAFLKGNGATVKIHFHPPEPANNFSCRKTLAQHCHVSIEKGRVLAIQGMEPSA